MNSSGALDSSVRNIYVQKPIVSKTDDTLNAVKLLPKVSVKQRVRCRGTSACSSEEEQISVSSENTITKRIGQRDGSDTVAMVGDLQELILTSAREEVKLQNRNFSLGVNDRDGKAKRKEWLQLEKELHRAQGLASWSVQATPLDAQLRMLGALRQAIEEAAFYLVEGITQFGQDSNLESNPLTLRSTADLVANDNKWESTTRRFRGDQSNYVHSDAPRYFVWPSPQVARCAIVQEAIGIYSGSTNVMRGVNSKSIVIVAVEQSEGIVRENLRQSPREAWGNEKFIADWSRACCGLAEMVSVIAQSPKELRESINDILIDMSRESNLSPVLVCTHASGDSGIMSDVSSIRSLCDSFHARLCVEGSALAMIAQPDRPADPEECLKEANVLLLDPGMWFGFKMCAVLTRHDSYQQVSERSFTSLQAFSNNEDRQGVATGPVLNLWTVLSRIGLLNIRSSIDHATGLAESFVHIFESSSNVHAIYDGIGCVIMLTYAMSREDRLMTKQKANENISRVNNTIFVNLERESRALMIQESTMGGISYLQFAPTLLLSAGTFWMPRLEDIAIYAEKVQETVDRYESCKAGSVSFQGAIAKCKDLNLVTQEDGGPTVALCYGAVRVVPREISTSWRETTSSVDLVRELTHLLVSELQNSVGDIFAKSFSLQQAFGGSGICSGLEPKRKRVAKDSGSACEGTSSVSSMEEESHPGLLNLPFTIYVNKDLENGTPDYLSVEPNHPCRPVEAVRRAALSAELLNLAVEDIISDWRSSNMISQIPRDLANVAGQEDFIPLTPTREELGFNTIPGTSSRARTEETGWPLKAEQTKNSDDRNLEDLAEPFGIEITESDTDQFYSVQGEAPGDHGGFSSSSEASSFCGSEIPGKAHGTNPAEQQAQPAPNNEGSWRIPFFSTRPTHPSRIGGEESLNLDVGGPEEFPSQRQHLEDSGRLPLNQPEEVTRSRWLGSWGRETTRQKRESETKRNAKDMRRERNEKRDSSEESTEGDGSPDRRGDSGGSTSPSEAGESSDDSDSDEEETDDDVDKTEQSFSDGSYSTSSDISAGERSDDKCRDSDVGRRPGQPSSTPRTTTSGYFSWFRRSEANTVVAEPAYSREESDNESSSGEDSSDRSVDTRLSEVPSDWVSRQIDDWDSQEWASSSTDSHQEKMGNKGLVTDKGKKPSLAQQSPGPSAFGIAWLRRRYFQTKASANNSTGGSAGEKGRANDRSEDSFSSSYDNESELSESYWSGQASAKGKLPSSREETSEDEKGSGSSGSSEDERELSDESASSEETKKYYYSEDRSSSSEERSTESGSSASSNHSEESDRSLESSSASETSDNDNTSYDTEDERGLDQDSSSESESESETEARSGRRKEAMPSRTVVGRYISWLTPNWLSRRSPTDAKRVNRERGESRYADTSSESEEERGWVRHSQRSRAGRSGRGRRG